MSQFEHVMVLLSIIVGLGIGHILVGVGGIVDRVSGHGERIALSLAHAAWLAYVLAWMLMFWWWEYNLGSLIDDWSLQLYYFIALYGIVLFLLAVTLVPRSWDGVDDLGAYFLSKRRWFFCLLVVANAMDVADSYAKGGWDYVLDTGVWGVGLAAVSVPVAIIGLRSTSARVHAGLAVVMLAFQIASGFGNFPLLGGRAS